jgi:hypothetical protein
MSGHVLFVLSTEWKKEACTMRESIDVWFNKAVTLTISGDKLGKNKPLNDFPVPQEEPRYKPEIIHWYRQSDSFPTTSEN